MKNENWKNKIFNLHFPICTFKYNNIAMRNVLEAQAALLWRRRRSASMGAPRQWALRVNGRSASMDALAFASNACLTSTHEGVRAAR